MANLDIPEPQKLSKQLILIAVVLAVVGVLIVVFAKVAVGIVVFLIATVLGIGSQVTKDNPLNK
jgi:hypothetical protein